MQPRAARAQSIVRCAKRSDKTRICNSDLRKARSALRTLEAPHQIGAPLQRRADLLSVAGHDRLGEFVLGLTGHPLPVRRPEHGLRFHRQIADKCQIADKWTALVERQIAGRIDCIPKRALPVLGGVGARGRRACGS